MRILSLNTWGGRLWSELADYLAGSDVDILCLQEMVHTPTTDTDWLDYRDGAHVLPQRANLFHDIAVLLPDHVAAFCPAARGELWHGDTALPSFWGLATFVRRDLAVIGQAQGFVHKRFSPHGYGNHPRSRNAHVVRIYDAARDRMVTVGHMHGLRDLAGKADTPERLVQAERFAALLAGVAAPDDALVACGDFNIEPESATFAILARLGLAEIAVAAAPEGTRTSHYTKPGRFADYLLVNDRALPRAFQVVRDPEVSDHCPLLLEL